MNKTARGMNQVISQSQIRLELVARLFAERGMKRLFRLMHGIIRRHQDIPAVVRLRNKFIPIDPREWRERQDMTVSVGLGSGTRQEQIGGIQQILATQMQMMQGGAPFVKPNNVYNTLTKWTELLGYKDVQNYWTDPQEAPPQQEGAPDPAIAAQMRVETAKIQAQQQSEMAKLQQQHELKTQEIAAKERSDGVKLQFERQKAERDFQIEVRKLQIDQEQFTAKQYQDAALKREELKVELMGKTVDAEIERSVVGALGG